MRGMGALVGTPSDDIPEVVGTGRSGVTSIYVSMSARHPEGRDADYLLWHCFAHRPEQYRLASIRGSLRLVSTPACRAARAACETRYDAVDHVMTYFFADVAGLEEFYDLAVALRGGGRIPYLLPMVERAVYALDGVAAAPRVKVGADVLPWWPAEGGYVLVERGEAPGDGLVDVDGVAGAWWGRNVRVDELYATGEAGTQVTYCFLDDDPVAVAERLRPALESRWASGVEPLFAAPFHVVLSHDLTRYLP
jgi:hypothetical protein